MIDINSNIKFTGQTKRTDDLGRIQIPKDVRKELNIDDGDSLDVYIYEDIASYGVLFRKLKPLPY